MENLQEFLSSGLLELYILGDISAENELLVEKMRNRYPEIEIELEEIAIAMENYAIANAVEPDPTLKPFLLAKIDYMDRMKNGETFSSQPLLNENSTAEDYEEWLNRPDMAMPLEIDDVYAKILGASENLITAIVWITKMAPQEVHDNEYEKFLILEGTCTIYVEDQEFNLKAGDYLQIPLHKNHHVQVTSTIPCKVILQRIAA